MAKKKKIRATLGLERSTASAEICALLAGKGWVTLSELGSMVSSVKRSEILQDVDDGQIIYRQKLDECGVWRVEICLAKECKPEDLIF